MGLSVQEILRLVPFLKRRIYRFSDDLRQHVLGECIEAKVRAGESLRAETIDLLGAALEAQVEGGRVSAALNRVEVLEGFAVARELDKRYRTAHGFRRTRAAKRVVGILGAPRSGTSYLFNLLAWTTDWAVLTDQSHHLWSTWTIPQSLPRFLRNHSAEVLSRDTKRAKLDLGVSLPSEAECILNRAVPAYAHLNSHRYRCNEAHVVDLQLLERVFDEHATIFDSETVLMKSPFSSWRAKLLDAELPINTTWIHISRDAKDVERSIVDNGFEYELDDVMLDARQARAFFVQSAQEVHPIELRYERLCEDPAGAVSSLLELIGATPTRLPPDTSSRWGVDPRRAR